MEPDSFVKNDHKVEKKLDCRYLGLILDSKFLFQNLKKEKILQKLAQGYMTTDILEQ